MAAQKKTQVTLLVLPSAEGGEAILSEHSGGGAKVRRIPLDRLSAMNVSDVHLVLPGQVVRMFETELPKAGRAQQLKMARFAREDDIASGADDLHFALSDAQPPRLAVIDTAILQRLVETYASLRPRAAYADYDLLQGDSAVQILDRAVEPGQAAIDLDWTEATLETPTDEQLVDRFLDGIARGEALNLLQGDFRPGSNLNLPRPAMIRFGALAASALVAFFVWSGVQDRAALAQAEDLRAQTAADYLAATGERAPSNPGRTAARSVQAGPAAPTGFLDLSSVLFSGLSNTRDVRVDQLRYNQSEGTLRLRLIYPSFDAASQAEAAIARAGGVLRTGGVREQDGDFLGEATLSLEPTS